MLSKKMQAIALEHHLACGPFDVEFRELDDRLASLFVALTQVDVRHLVELRRGSGNLRQVLATRRLETRASPSWRTKRS